MCILFLYVAKQEEELAKPSQPSGGIKLIIASNRDESYSRPTTPAKFWETDSNILAGQDCEEGGTWLGISKTGKLAVLLNITSKAPPVKLRSRGDLVTGFLKSDPDLRGLTYLTNLHQADIRKSYALFNLVTIDLQPLPIRQSQTLFLPESSTTSKLKASSYCDITYFTNGSEAGPKILGGEGESQIYGFGNSVYDSPFCKVVNGCREFKEIINSHAKSINNVADVDGSHLETLKGHLLNFLKSSTKHYPDPQLEKQAQDAGLGARIPTLELTSVFVTTPVNYGTRTHTILIIDSANNVNYHEWTMDEPINKSDPKWIESEYNFKIL